MKLSYWENESFIKNIDLLIIGSGIVGLNAAIAYKKKFPKHKVVILEKGVFPSGASTKNAGFACFGSLTELMGDLEIMSKDQVYEIVEKRWKGLHALMHLTGKDSIDFFQYGSYELFLDNENDIYDNALNSIEEINKDLEAIFPKPVFSLADPETGKMGFQGVKHLIKNNFEGQINTGKMMSKLLDISKHLGIDILNGVDVLSIEDIETPTLITNIGKINSTKCIIATNGFTKQLFPEIDVNPARAQVLITKPIEGLKVKGTFHYNQGYYYFRNIDNRILFGGGRNLDFKGETTTAMEVTENIQNELDTKLRNVILPNQSFEIDYRWAGVMGIGNTKKTIVEKLSDNTVAAVRLGGMGVAIGTLIGQEAVELLNQ